MGYYKDVNEKFTFFPLYILEIRNSSLDGFFIFYQKNPLKSRQNNDSIFFKKSS